MHASSVTIDELPALVESLCADHVVFTPVGHLDLVDTESLINRAAAALRCGYTVMIDLDPSTSSDELIAHGPVPRDGATIVGDHGPVRILGPGLVQLNTADMLWTIDLNGSRLVRSEHRIDPHFLTASGWRAVRAVWANCETVTALTLDDTYLSCRAVWTASTDRS